MFERAANIRERIQKKREQLMFSKKLALIDRHLKDSKHPLRLLRKRFSQELLDYYQLFLDVNKQTLETQANITHKDKE